MDAVGRANYDWPDPSTKGRRMRLEKLTFKGLRARPVILELNRPVIARIATITDWPLILVASIPKKVLPAEAIWSPLRGEINAAPNSRVERLGGDAQGCTDCTL